MTVIINEILCFIQQELGRFEDDQIISAINKCARPDEIKEAISTLSTQCQEIDKNAGSIGLLHTVKDIVEKDINLPVYASRDIRLINRFYEYCREEPKKVIDALFTEIKNIKEFNASRDSAIKQMKEANGQRDEAITKLQRLNTAREKQVMELQANARNSGKNTFVANQLASKQSNPAPFQNQSRSVPPCPVRIYRPYGATSSVSSTQSDEESVQVIEPAIAAGSPKYSDILKNTEQSNNRAGEVIRVRADQLNFKKRSIQPQIVTHPPPVSNRRRVNSTVSTDDQHVQKPSYLKPGLRQSPKTWSGVPKTAIFFIDRVPKDISAEDVMDYCNASDVQAGHHGHLVSRDYSRVNSFKLFVDYGHISAINQAGFWPPHVQCRRWVDRPRQENTVQFQ